MISWISQHWGTLLVALILLAILIPVTISVFSKKGKGSCGCGCEGCAMSGSCSQNKK